MGDYGASIFLSHYLTGPWYFQFSCTTAHRYLRLVTPVPPSRSSYFRILQLAFTAFTESESLSRFFGLGALKPPALFHTYVEWESQESEKTLKLTFALPIGYWSWGYAGSRFTTAPVLRMGKTWYRHFHYSQILPALGPVTSNVGKQTTRRHTPALLSVCATQIIQKFTVALFNRGTCHRSPYQVPAQFMDLYSQEEDVYTQVFIPYKAKKKRKDLPICFTQLFLSLLSPMFMFWSDWVPYT